MNRKERRLADRADTGKRQVDEDSEEQGAMNAAIGRLRGSLDRMRSDIREAGGIPRGSRPPAEEEQGRKGLYPHHD